MGAPQPPAGATPPRATKRGGPGTPMAHRGRWQLPLPSPAPWQGLRSLPPCREWHSGVPATREPPGGFSRYLQDALFPPWIIGRGSMTAWEARIVGEEWACESGWWCAATRDPETPAQRYAAIPLEEWGPHTQLRPTIIRGAGPDHSWHAAMREWLQAAQGPQTELTGDVSSLIRAPVPPRIVLHAANVLRATEIHTWGHDVATMRWHPPEDGAARLAVAHFKTALRAHLDQVPLNYSSETVVQPSSTAHVHYGLPTVEPLSWYSNKLLSSNLGTAIFQPSKRCHTA